MKECLVVVDYQTDFVTGVLGFDGAELLDKKIVREIYRTRASGGDVIFTLDTHTPAYLSTPEGKALPVEHCIKGTAGHALYGLTAQAVRPEDMVFEKPAFGSAELASFVAQKGYEKVTLVGLVSHICVLTNAVLIKTFRPEAEIIVYSQLTGAADQELHEAAMKVLKSIQITVL